MKCASARVTGSLLVLLWACGVARSSSSSSASVSPAPSAASSPAAHAELMSNALGWGYVSALPETWAQWKASRFAAVLPDDVRERTETFSTGGSQALAWTLGFEEGCAFRGARGPRRAGCAVRASWFPVSVDELAKITALPQVRSLRSAQPSSAGGARLHLARYLARRAQQPGGRQLLQRLRRLGLARAESLSAWLWIDGPTRLRARGELRLSGGREGVLAAFGPQVSVGRPRVAGADVVAYAVASVRPARLWLAGERVVAGLHPMEHTLWLLQLEALEEQLKKRFIGDVLGEAPTLWSVYAYRLARSGSTSSATSWVMDLQVADGRSALRFVEVAALVACGLAPEWAVSRRRVSGVELLEVRRGRRGGSRGASVAFLSDRVLVAPREDVLLRHMARVAAPAAEAPPAAGPKAPGEPPALAFGELTGVTDAAARAALERGILAQGLDRDQRSAVAAAIGRSVARLSWHVRPSRDGFAARVEILAPR